MVAGFEYIVSQESRLLCYLLRDIELIGPSPQQITEVPIDSAGYSVIHRLRRLHRCPAIQQITHVSIDAADYRGAHPLSRLQRCPSSHKITKVPARPINSEHVCGVLAGRCDVCGVL